MKTNLALRTGVFVMAAVLAGCGGGGSSDPAAQQTGGGSTAPPGNQPVSGTPAPAPGTVPAPAPVGGEPAWSAPTAAASEAASASTVAIDGTGKGFVGWVGAGGAVKVARQAQPGGAWEAGQTLGAGDPGAPAGVSPQVVADAQGNALAAWVQVDNGVKVVMANQYSAAQGSWGQPQQISKDTAAVPIDLQLTQDGAGNGVALWSWNSSSGGIPSAATDVARFDATTRSWPQSPTALMRRSGSNAPGRVAANPEGDTVATWTINTESETAVMTSRRDRTTGTWAQAASSPYPGAFPREALGRIAVLGDGSAVKAWLRRAGGQADPYKPVLTLAALDGAGKIAGQTQEVASFTDQDQPEFVEVQALGSTGTMVVWGRADTGVSWQFRTAPATAGTGGTALVPGPLVLDDPSAESHGPAMAQTADGKLLLTVCRADGPAVRSFDPATQAWTPVTVTTDTSAATSCDVASSSGGVAVSWQPAGKAPVVTIRR